MSVIFENINKQRTQIFASDSIGKVSRLIKLDDTLFVAGNSIIAGDFAKPYFATLVGKKVVKRYKDPAHLITLFKGTGRRLLNEQEINCI